MVQSFLPHNAAFVVAEKYVPGIKHWILSVDRFFQQYAEKPGEYTSTTQGLQLGDIIETVCLEYAVKLLPNLGHHNEGVRAQVQRLFAALASVFDDDQVGTRAVNSNAEAVQLSSYEDEKAKLLSVEDPMVKSVMMTLAGETDIHQSVHTLFKTIGKALHSIVVGLVGELEMLYVNPDPTVRDVAISATTRLIAENPSVFINQDNLASVWNLFFLLDYMSGDAKKTVVTESGSRLMTMRGTRMALIEALNVLSPIYTKRQRALTVQIVSRLLKLPDKSTREMEEIKNALAHIFRDVVSLGSDASFSLYPTFLSLLTAHHESYYDLLHWSVLAYTRFLFLRFHGQELRIPDKRRSLKFRTSALSTAVASAAASSALSSPYVPPSSSPLSSSSSSSFAGRRGGRSTGKHSELVDAILKDSSDIDGDVDETEEANVFSSVQGDSMLTSAPATLASGEVSFPAELLTFYNSLSSHFRAAPPLIRYGAAVCINALLLVFPDAVVHAEGLYATIVSNCSDSHFLTRQLYLTTLKQIARHLRLAHLYIMCRARLNQFKSGDSTGDGYQALKTLIALHIPPTNNRDCSDPASSFASSSSRLSGHRLATMSEASPSSHASRPSRPSTGDTNNDPNSPASLCQLAELLSVSLPTIDDIISAAIAVGPNIPPSLLVSLLTAVDLLRRPQQLLQLRLVRHWTTRAESLDAHFVQKLMPYLKNDDADIQHSVVEIFKALAPSLHLLSDHLFNGVATYFRTAMDQDEAHTLCNVLSCLSVFPYERLDNAKISSILDVCLLKILHPNWKVRFALYTMIADCVRFWKVDTHTNENGRRSGDGNGDGGGVANVDLLSKAAGILVMGLADLQPTNVYVALTGLIQLVREISTRSSSGLSDAHDKDVLLELLHSFVPANFQCSSPLASLSSSTPASSSPSSGTSSRKNSVSARDAGTGTSTGAGAGAGAGANGVGVGVGVGDGDGDGENSNAAGVVEEDTKGLVRRTLLPRIRSIDRLAQLLALNKDSDSSECASARIIGRVLISDTFRPFYTKVLEAVQSYHRLPIFPHLWILIASNMGVMIHKTNPALFLRPLLVSDDSHVRRATCHAFKRACFKGESVNGAFVQALIKALHALLTRTGPEVECAYYIMHLLVPHKIQKLNKYFVDSFLEQAIIVMLNSATPTNVRKMVIIFIEALLLARPLHCSVYAEQLRNVTRELLSRTLDVQEEVSRLYCAICHAATAPRPVATATNSIAARKAAKEEAEKEARARGFAYFNYLKGDLSQEEWVKDADPLLNKLSSVQVKLVCLTTIRALGCFQGKATASAIIEEISPFLHNQDPTFRCFALETVLNQSRILTDNNEKVYAYWCCLPLLADTDFFVRATFQEGPLIANFPSRMKHVVGLMGIDSDDKVPSSSSSPASLSSSGQEFLPTSLEYLSSRSQLLLSKNDTFAPLYCAEPEYRHAVFAAVKRKPSVNKELFDMFERIFNRLIKVFPKGRLEEIVYHLHALYRINQLGAASALVISLIVRLVDSKSAMSLLKAMLYQVDSDLTGANRSLIMGCVYGTQNITNHCDWAIPVIFDHFASLSQLKEGDMYCLRAIVSSMPDGTDLNRLVSMDKVHILTDRLLDVLKGGRKQSKKPMRKHKRQATLLSGNTNPHRAQGLSGNDDSPTTGSTNKSKASLARSNSKEIALEIFASLCLLVDVKDISSVIEYIFEMLDNSSDPSFHDLARKQLDTLFSSLSIDHPLIDTFLSSLNDDAKSPRMESRLRALTIMVVLKSKMTREQSTMHVLRLLADPQPEVQLNLITYVVEGALSMSLKFTFISKIQELTGERAPLETLSTLELLNLHKQVNREHSDRRHAENRSDKPMFGDISASSPSSSTSEPQTQASGDANDPGATFTRSTSVYGYNKSAKQIAGTAHAHAHSRQSSASFSIMMGGGPQVRKSITAKVAEAAAEIGGLQIPLPDTDPFNLKYLQSVDFLTLLRIYGMDRINTSIEDLMNKPMNAKGNRQGEQEEGQEKKKDDGGITPSLSDVQKIRIIADIRAKTVMQYDLRPLIHMVMDEEPEQADNVLNDLIASLQAIKANDDHIDFDGKMHELNLLMNLLSAFPSVSPKYHYVRSIYQIAAAYRHIAHSLRQQIMAYLHELSFSRSNVGPVSLVDQKAYEKRKQYEEAMGSNLTGKKQLNATKKQLSKNNALRVAVDKDTEKMSSLTILLIQLITKLGDILGKTSAQMKDKDLIDSTSWLKALFDDVHRGIRTEAGQAIVSIAQAHYTVHKSRWASVRVVEVAGDDKAGHEEKRRRRRRSLVTGPPSYIAYMQNLVEKLYEALNNKRASRRLHRKKADVLHMLTRIITYSNDRMARQEVINVIISMWDDGDSGVRKVAIDSMRYLKAIGYPELQALLETKGVHESSAVMRAIMKRVKDPQYPSVYKSQLTDLLHSLF